MFYSIVKNIANKIFRLLFKFNVYGVENTPSEGKFILCSNHASNWDPLFISIFIPRQISWMGKKELFKNKILSYLLNKLHVFPVDRDHSDITAIKNALRVLKNEGVLGIFPEGTRVSKMDLEGAKPGISMISIKSKSPILPIYIESNYKLFSKVNIYIGKPMDILDEGKNRYTSEEYTEKSKKILERIYGLKNI